tara:strand:- start:147 stop:314 length:168 start_codon:yes stop_codon:yes gene_type:complete
MAFNNAIGVPKKKVLKSQRPVKIPVKNSDDVQAQVLRCKEVYKAIYTNILGSQTR